ncbi:hypothetical protein F9C07_7895 [Aspergillus flavus]|uniref:Uncharacterized protein n=1 Tax=Aspergillus flavus (strain ATCC 200026 / FGSC A1120 / IAM 13836 / NRRL 3357 / JCM 12722 / SRRC 167) TaxID=332952 RepID=A0A7U2N0P7_ASPFN|nr:hypothetical protein F9C07_7895 [Aspergillus flavus]
MATPEAPPPLHLPPPGSLIFGPLLVAVQPSCCAVHIVEQEPISGLTIPVPYNIIHVYHKDPGEKVDNV